MEKNVMKRLGKNTAFVVSDVEFEPGPLGGRELCISWNDLNDYIRIQVLNCCDIRHVDLLGWSHFRARNFANVLPEDSSYGYEVNFRCYKTVFLRDRKSCTDRGLLSLSYTVTLLPPLDKQSPPPPLYGALLFGEPSL